MHVTSTASGANAKGVESGGKADEIVKPDERRVSINGATLTAKAAASALGQGPNTAGKRLTGGPPVPEEVPALQATIEPSLNKAAFRHYMQLKR